MILRTTRRPNHDRRRILEHPHHHHHRARHRVLRRSDPSVAPMTIEQIIGLAIMVGLAIILKGKP
jgi:hypothetical protein